MAFHLFLNFNCSSWFYYLCKLVPVGNIIQNTDKKHAMQEDIKTKFNVVTGLRKTRFLGFLKKKQDFIFLRKMGKPYS